MIKRPLQEIYSIRERIRELKDSKCKKERVHSHALILLNSGRDIKEVAELYNVPKKYGKLC